MEKIVDESEVSEEALHIAARCWCDKETGHAIMDERLAMAFARRLTPLLVDKKGEDILLLREAIITIAQTCLPPEVQRCVFTVLDSLSDIPDTPEQEE